MKKVYLRCRHGVKLISLIPCEQCENDKVNFSYTNPLKYAIKSERTPIYRGCNAIGSCFCSGKCKEIIGYNEPE